MIRAAFEKFRGWWTTTAWPAIEDGSTRWFRALYADPFMHGVTAVLAIVAAQIVRVFW